MFWGNVPRERAGAGRRPSPGPESATPASGSSGPAPRVGHANPAIRPRARLDLRFNLKSRAPRGLVDGDLSHHRPTPHSRTQVPPLPLPIYFPSAEQEPVRNPRTLKVGTALPSTPPPHRPWAPPVRHRRFVSGGCRGVEPEE